tara:strand:- start:3201 stop:3461 length:261 start_codon:yes stop_codon:yes gene_type:complete
MKKYFSVLVLFIVMNSFGQEFKKFNYQFNAATTISILYKKTITVQWQGYVGNPISHFGTNYGYLFELMTYYNINKKTSLNTDLIII